MLNILRRSNSDGRKPSWLILRHRSDRAYTTGDAWEAEQPLSQSSPEKDLSTAGLVFTSSTAGGSFCTSCKKHLVWLTCWSLEGSQGNETTPFSLGVDACGPYPSTLCTAVPFAQEEKGPSIRKEPAGPGLGD